MLGLEEPILAGDIYWVKIWKEEKVFQLNGYGEDRVVVKQESEKFSKGDIRMSSYFMAAVDPGAKAVPLTSSEMAQLVSWAEENVPYPGLCPGASELLAAINASRANNNPWIKMRAFRLIEADKAGLKFGKGDKTDVRLISKTLNAPGGLEKLGMILAADFFIGNTDRFTYLDKGYGCEWPPRPAPGREQLRCTANVGNVFVTIDPEQGKALVGGLDYLDPNGMFRVQTKDIVAEEKRSDSEWLGRLLIKSNGLARMTYAQAAVEDLNFILGPRNRKIPFSCKDRLPPGPSANRLNFGIETGADKLRKSLKGLGNLPPTLQSRLGVLGWPK